MIVKIIKCLLLAILILVVMSILFMGIALLKNMIGEDAVILIFISVVMFGTVFALGWTTLF